MELDDMKQAWQILDRRVAALEAVVPATGRGGVSAELRPLVIGQWIQVFAGVLWAMAAGSFWFDHRAGPDLLVAGILLHLYGMAMAIVAARNLWLAGRARASAPVLE